MAGTFQSGFGKWRAIPSEAPRMPSRLRSSRWVGQGRSRREGTALVVLACQLFQQFLYPYLEQPSLVPTWRQVPDRVLQVLQQLDVNLQRHRHFFFRFVSHRRSLSRSGATREMAFRRRAAPRLAGLVFCSHLSKKCANAAGPDRLRRFGWKKQRLIETESASLTRRVAKSKESFKGPAFALVLFAHLVPKTLSSPSCVGSRGRGTSACGRPLSCR
jgi:hypothetical protein